jgi:hypothetical protein
MSDIEGQRPTILNLHEDGTSTLLEVPSLNEVLGERIVGLEPGARTFLKLQMLVRDQDFIGIMNNENSLAAMLSELIQGGYLTGDSAVDLYHTAMQTYEDYKIDVMREAERLGIPIPSQDPSSPTRLQ